MKEFIVNTYCDQCSREGRQEPAETTPAISLGSDKPKTLDLCERHRKEILEALSDLLRTEGVRVEEPLGKAAAKKTRRSGQRITDKTPGPFPCLVPGCPGLRSKKGPNYPSRGSLKNHLGYAHDIKFDDYVARYGEPQQAVVMTTDSQQPDDEALPYDADVDSTPHALEVCGIDGCQVSYPPEQYKNPAQAMGVHRSSKHGVRGSSRRAQERAKTEAPASVN